MLPRGVTAMLLPTPPGYRPESQLPDNAWTNRCCHPEPFAPLRTGSAKDLLSHSQSRSRSLVAPLLGMTGIAPLLGMTGNAPLLGRRRARRVASGDLLGRGFPAGGDGQGGKEKRDGPADDLGAAQDLVVAEALRRGETGPGPRRGDGAAVPQGNLRVSTIMEDQQWTWSGGSGLDHTQLFPRDSVPRREPDLHRIADRSRHPADARETARIFLGIGEGSKQNQGADAKTLTHRQHAGRRAEGVADETHDVPGVFRHREDSTDKIGDGTAPPFRSAVTRSVERDHGEARLRQGSHETTETSGMSSPSVDEEHRGTLSPPPRREPAVA